MFFVSRINERMLLFTKPIFVFIHDCVYDFVDQKEKKMM